MTAGLLKDFERRHLGGVSAQVAVGAPAGRKYLHFRYSIISRHVQAVRLYGDGDWRRVFVDVVLSVLRLEALQRTNSVGIL